MANTRTGKAKNRGSVTAKRNTGTKKVKRETISGTTGKVKIRTGNSEIEVPIGKDGTIPEKFLSDYFNNPYQGVRKGRKKRDPAKDVQSVNSKTVKKPHTPKKVRNWLHDPSRSDLEGIDTPKKQTSKTDVDKKMNARNKGVKKTKPVKSKAARAR